MISMAYDPARETIRFVRRKISFVFAAFSTSHGPERNRLENDGGFRARAAEVPVAAREDEAVGRLGNGAASR
jgi:hypothetical protein